MDDDQPRKPEPVSLADKLACAGFLLLILGLFAAELMREYTPAKLTAFLILLFWIPLLVVHEIGHALTAALLGWHVARVVIGMGPQVTRFLVGSTLVEIRLVPIEGFVEPVPKHLRSPQLRSALIYLAGPGTELLILLLLVLVFGTSTLLTSTEAYHLLAVQSLAVAILISVFCNLFPHYGSRHLNDPSISDGLGILRSLRLPKEYYASLMGKRYDFLQEPEEEGEEDPGR
jgi:hypothetical protein